MRNLVVILFSLAALSGCATYPTSQPPLRDADVYPNVQTIAGLAVAVDEVSDPDRSRQYFGVDLTGEDILPIMIVFSNHGNDRFLVKPSDIILLQGDTLLDPVPIERMQQVAKGGLDMALQETTIPPHGNYRGVLFFKVRKQAGGLVGKVEKVLTNGVRMPVIVTNRDSGERIRFGPFSLSGLTG